MYFSKNSRYVLQKAHLFTSSSSFLTLLRGNEKNLSVKFPKDDPARPPLRRNIPADSTVELYPNVIPDARSRELSENRSKNIVTKNSSPAYFDDGSLPPGEREIQVPNYTPQQYFPSENPKNEPGISDASILPADKKIGDVLLSGKNAEKSQREKGDKNADGSKMPEDRMEASGKEGNENHRILHIIIDFPPKLEENISLNIAQPESDAEKSPSKNISEKREAPVPRKFLKKELKKWRSKSLEGKPNKKRFEVHEIEDSGAYILHLRLKNTSEVNVVPEKQVRTRNAIHEFFEEPSPAPKASEKPGREKMIEKEAKKKKEQKLSKRERKHRSSSEKVGEKKDAPTNELMDWQQPQYYELPVSDSFETKKIFTSLKRLGRQRYSSSKPTFKVLKAKEEPEEVSAKENLSKKMVEEVAGESKQAEKEKVAEGEAEAEKEVTEPHATDEELVLSNYKDPHEHSNRANLPAEDSRPPPTDWIVPHFMEYTVESPQEVKTATEEKPEPVKNIKTATSNDKKEKVKIIKRNPDTQSPGPKIVKSERYELDITDFKSGTSHVPIKCDKPTHAMKLSAAYPPLLNEAMKRRYYRYTSNSLYNGKPFMSSGPEFEMNPKSIETSPIKIAKRNERSLGANKTTSVPQMSHNMCNIANESTTQSKGTASVDSLAIMKKVKEIVDLDLNNAIKIFKPDSGSATSSVIISKGFGEYRLDEKELTKCSTVQRSEFLNEIKKAESMPNFLLNDVEVNPPKYLPPTKEGQTEMKLSQSVVILNPDTNKFIIDVEDLQEAIRRRTEESFDDVVVEKLKGFLAGSKSEPILVFNGSNYEKTASKSGDSILVFDEETQRWKVDFSILERREQQQKVEEELTKRSELILETIEKLEKDHIPSISKPETRDRKTFDYNKEEWKDYGQERKPKNVKSPFKESDAKEIRRKNSDLYNDLFVKKDNIKKTDGVLTEMKVCKEASTTESGTTKETPGMKPDPISKKPETAGHEKDSPEDDNYWETFLNTNIPVWNNTERKITDVAEKEKPKIRAPVPPPSPPTPPGPPVPPVSIPTGPKIEEPKFRIHLPLRDMNIIKKRKAPEVPPKTPQKEKQPKDTVAPASKENPKLNVPPSQKKQKEPKMTVPPPAQSPAVKKEEPKAKPLKKDDPKGKPLTAVKKEEPKEKLTPGKKKEKEVPSSTSATKIPPKVDDKKGANIKAPPSTGVKPKEDPKTGGKKDKVAADHYISENIVELSRKDKNSKIKPNKLETVKLNISTDKRLPSKVMEINLNKNFDKSKESTDGAKKKKNSENKVDNRIFYKKFEKYKSPFSDLEYEEKSMKIKSDIASNPNLKKLDNWNKTLVLQNIGKPPENMETWLKDETDKMATLLLKVLQEASDGKPKRKHSRSRLSEKSQPKANPYDNIRKKQEKVNPESFLFKPTKSEKMLEVKRSGAKEEKLMKTSQLISMAPGQPTMPGFDIMDPLLSKELLRQCRLVNDITDDIPGPEALKKISNIWKVFPAFSIQMTVFTLFRLFQLVNTGKSILDVNGAEMCRHHAFEKLFAKYGPIVNVQGLLSGSVILIYKPEHLSAVFEQDASIPVRSVFDSLEQSRRETEEKNVSVGIFTEWNSSQWTELKKKTNDPLIKGRERFLTSVESAGDALIYNILKTKNQKYHDLNNFLDDIKRWSLEGLCSVLFEKSFGFLERNNKSRSWIQEPDKLYRTVEAATSYLSKCERGFQMWRLMTTPASAGLKQSYRTLSGIIAKQIYQAEANLKNRNELLKNKIEAQKDLTFLESMLLNDGMTSEEIICNLIDIMLIGTNAMNSALAFSLYDLAQNVSVQNRLLHEIKEILPEKNSRLDFHKFQSLKYIQACLKETLRLHMPVPIFFRLLQNDILLSNYIVPKGTYVVMDYRVSSMREHVFEEPDKFRPERWLSDEKWIQSFHPFSTLPLCHGPRSELAKRVVEMQILACVAKIIRNFQVEYHFGEIHGTDSIIAFPDKPLKFNFVERDF